MGNPYTQVALSYIRHLQSLARLGFLIVAALLLCMMLVASLLALRHGSPQFVLVLTLVFFDMLAAHVREQLMDWPARLTPNYRRPHATMAAVAAIGLAVGLPAAFTLLAGLRSAGFMGVSMLLCGGLAWLRVTWAFPVWPLLMWFIADNVSLESLLNPLITGQRETAALALLMAGMAIMLAAGWRLVGMKGDVSDYHWRRPNRLGEGTSLPPRPSEHRTILSHLRDKLAEGRIARLTTEARRADVSGWARIGRWRVGMPGGMSALAISLYAVAAAQLMVWWNSNLASNPMLMALVSTISPVCALSGLAQRRHTVPHELLRPVDRAAFVKEIGAAAALSHFEVWGAANLAILTWWILISLQPPSLDLLTILIAISALSQIWLFGLAAWLFQYRATKRLIVGMGLGATVPMMLMVPNYEQPEARPFVLAAAGLLAAFGTLLTWAAYRRWLVLDLD